MSFFNASILKKLLLLFATLVVLHYSKAFLMPLTIGGIIATLFLPFCNWMEAKKIPRGLTAFFSLLLIILLVSAILFLIGWKISSLASDLDSIKLKAIEKFNAFQNYLLVNFGIALEKQSQIFATEQPSYSNIAQKVAGSLQYLFINAILILAYIFFLLFYRGHLKQFILKLSPAEERANTEDILYRTAKVSQNYLFGLGKMISLLWVLYSVGFGILGVDNFVFFAVVCGFLEIIPFVGNITGTTLTVFVSAINGASAAQLFGIVAVYGTVQFIQGWFLEPLILGPQVKINPLFTIVALLLGEMVWGIPGIIVAIPAIAMLKITCDNVESLKPYGFLIGDVDNGKKRIGILRRLNIFKPKD